MYSWLGGGFKYFLCSPLFGEMIQFDEHIFQMGWFNHQLVDFLSRYPGQNFIVTRPSRSRHVTKLGGLGSVDFLQNSGG